MFWPRAVTVDGSHNLERDFLSLAFGWWHKLDRTFLPSPSFRATRAVLCCVLIPTNETDGSSAASCHGELCVLIHACRVFMQTFRSTYHGYWDILTTTRVNLLIVMEVKDTRYRRGEVVKDHVGSFVHIHLRSQKDRIYLIWILELLVSCRWRCWEGNRRRRRKFGRRAGAMNGWSFPFSTTQILLFSQHIKSSCPIITENGKPYQRDSQQRTDFQISFPIPLSRTKIVFSERIELDSILNREPEATHQ